MTPDDYPTLFGRADRTGGPAACWTWTLSVMGSGYAQTTIPGRPRGYAHRLAYEVSKGPIPEGAYIDHMCHNKRCINPAHLQAVTNAENMQNRAGPAANSRSGVRGVYRQGSKWRAQIRANGRNHNGGCFDSLEEAAEAARLLRLRLQPNSLLDRSA